MKYLFQGIVLSISLLVATPCFAKGYFQKSSHKPSGSEKTQEFQWESYHQAMERSKQDRKYVGLFFTGSDWCIWCIRMQDQILSSQEFKEFAAKELHMVELDFPRSNVQSIEEKQLNQELKSKYGVSGYPMLVFVDANGVEKARMGFEYGGGKNYVEKIKQALRLK